ncbi:hypothetical protein B0T20DRAFT_473821 [Sordaria brevicollis]|uniref:Nephrocystin 3-like N-terminal domain-containing protein n=1 Tax=Sordaria brevicollis TaxID=83679 RepID=A0AAE0NV91_SORBR|nr:hypothetical protein B0T20DRAFT_473821 [Sordaria brevicollis]
MDASQANANPTLVLRDHLVALQLAVKVIRTYPGTANNKNNGLDKVIKEYKDLSKRFQAEPPLTAQETTELLGQVQECLGHAWTCAESLYNLGDAPELKKAISPESGWYGRISAFYVLFFHLLCCRYDITGMRFDSIREDRAWGCIEGNLVKFLLNLDGIEREIQEQAKCELPGPISNNLEKIPEDFYMAAQNKFGMPVASDAYYESIADPHAGTFQWIFQPPKNGEENFVSWLKQHPHHEKQRMFWITGDPGTGKTVLLKYILKEIERRPSLLPGDSRQPHLAPIVLSYFSVSSAAMPEDSKAGSEWFEPWLSQLLQKFPREMCKVFVETYTTKIATAKWVAPSSWACGTFDKVFECCLKYLERRQPVYFFLDVDQVDDGLGYCIKRWEEDMFFASNIKVCVVSRPENDFHQWWQPHHERLILEHPNGKRSRTVFLEDHNAGDIRSFCESVLGKMPSDARRSHTDVIVRDCGGSFNAALDACELLLRDHGCSSDNRRNKKSAALLDIMLRDMGRNIKPIDEEREQLQELSFYLNMVLVSHKQQVTVGQQHRIYPLSLLKLASGLIRMAEQEQHEQADAGAGRGFETINLANTICGMAAEIETEFYPFVIIQQMDEQEIAPNFTFTDGSVNDEETDALKQARYTIKRAASMKVTVLNEQMRWVLQHYQKGVALLSLWGGSLTPNHVDCAIADVLGSKKWNDHIRDNGPVAAGNPFSMLRLMEERREQGEERVKLTLKRPDTFYASLEGCARCLSREEGE